eukprot:Pgem_evm2s18862
MGYTDISNAAYLVPSLMCIGSIAGLASQSTARIGNILGISGVATGLLVTLGHLNPDPMLLGQMIGALGMGGMIGGIVARRAVITDLPQMVAAYHSLVGLAATVTCASAYLLAPEADMFHAFAISTGAGIGALTLTGSVVAFGKLQGLLK